MPGQYTERPFERTTDRNGREAPEATVRSWIWSAACVLCVACGGEGGDEGPWVSPVPFDTASAVVAGPTDTARLLVEVARTGEQRSFGLSLRPTLESGSGMVFLYDSIQPGNAGYWMWRTRVPLDIAFVDTAGTIVRVIPMEPCTAVYAQGCPVYEPGVPYGSALEVNRGWFAERGLGEGATVRIEDADAP